MEMDKFTAALREKRECGNIFKSFGFVEVEDSERLEKSHVNEILSRDNMGLKQFFIEKKGKDVKEKLSKMRDAEAQEVASRKAGMEAIRVKLGESFVPSKSFKDDRYWMIDGWEDRITDIPMLFDERKYDVYFDRPASSSIDVVNPESDGQQVSKEVADDILKYNHLASMYVDGQKELAMLDTMLDNFDDTHIYKIPVETATMLGW